MILGRFGCSFIHVPLALLGFKTLNLKADSLPVTLPISMITLFFLSSFQAFPQCGVEFQAFIWQDTAAKGHRNIELVLYWTLLFSSTGQSMAAAMGKQGLCSFLPSYNMGTFQPTH